MSYYPPPKFIAEYMMMHTLDDRTSTLTDAAQWARQLDGVAQRIAARFPRSEPRQRATAYLRALVSRVERKNGWQLAEEAGDKTPYGVQHLLGRAAWSADAVRDDLRSYVVEHLGDEEAVLVVDETGFLKKGTQSVGVQRQYSGTAGRIENPQIGVFLAYAAKNGRTFLDREVYLPQGWAEDAERRRGAGVPKAAEFATKPHLARRMIERAVQSDVPFQWVTGDEVYGTDRRLRVWLEEQGIFHVMAVGVHTHVWVGFDQPRVKSVVEQIAEDAWQTLSCGAGATGERVYEWALAPLLSSMVEERQRWLVVRRKIGEPTEMQCYVVFASTATRLEEIVKVAGARWAIEESFETAKGEVGLDEYEVRSWAGWYRHITLALLAHAYLTVMRAEAARQEAQKKMLLKVPPGVARKLALSRARQVSKARQRS